VKRRRAFSAELLAPSRIARTPARFAIARVGMPRKLPTTTVTTSPRPPAPHLDCPTCDRELAYLRTLLGGVRPIERWDFYQCGTCSQRFEYRHRTRQMRVADAV
jgi:hypothetical protein